jgi:hypothetical protein
MLFGAFFMVCCTLTIFVRVMTDGDFQNSPGADNGQRPIGGTLDGGGHRAFVTAMSMMSPAGLAQRGDRNGECPRHL